MQVPCQPVQYHTCFAHQRRNHGDHGDKKRGWPLAIPLTIVSCAQHRSRLSMVVVLHQALHCCPFNLLRRISAVSFFIADLHDTGGITIRDMKTIRSNPVVAEAEASPTASSLRRVTILPVRIVLFLQRFHKFSALSVSIW